MVPRYTKEKHEQDDRQRQSAFGLRGRSRGRAISVPARSAVRGRGRGSYRGRAGRIAPTEMNAQGRRAGRERGSGETLETVEGGGGVPEPELEVTNDTMDRRDMEEEWMDMDGDVPMDLDIPEMSEVSNRPIFLLCKSLIDTIH